LINEERVNLSADVCELPVESERASGRLSFLACAGEGNL